MQTKQCDRINQAGKLLFPLPKFKLIIPNERHYLPILLLKLPPCYVMMPLHALRHHQTIRLLLKPCQGTINDDLVPTPPRRSGHHYDAS